MQNSVFLYKLILMKASLYTQLILLFFSSLFNLHAQLETQKWYFGNQAGLDFSTNPPTVLTNGMLNTSEGCATLSDAAGNLLFYTDGVTVYDKTHAIMANGTGLFGNSSTTQSSIIVKQPGNSNIFFVFTLGASGTGSLCFSTVDLSLAAGMGSVTIKNTLLSANMSEKLTAVRHCNGNEVWVISHENNSSNFRSYLVSSAGVNAAIITNVGSTISSSTQSWLGNLKASPTGRKLVMAISGSNGSFEIYDFDNTTGVPSNPFNLGSFPSAYGCEFSPDGSKLYGDRESGTNFLTLYQWDLCAGSATAIVASQFSLAVTSQIMGMQLASDGKIYIARMGASTLAVIANPNATGASCNYLHNGQSVFPKICRYNLPNFMTSYLKTSPQPFTYTVNCSVAQFTNPPPTSTLNIGCTAISNSVTGLLWNFGEPSSGANNTSTLSNPSHTYNAMGNYTPYLIIYSTCRFDTVKIPINVTGIVPTLNIAGSFTICKGDKRTYTVSGANSYTWSGNVFTPTIALSPTVNLVYTVSGTNAQNGCSSSKSFSITVNKCLGFVPEMKTESLKIFPNPFQNYLIVEAKKNTKINIFDQNGILIYQNIFEKDGEQKINTSLFAPGVYLINLATEEGSKKIRVVKLE
jgi:hypothetical protein